MTATVGTSLFRVSLGDGQGILGGPWRPLLASRGAGAAASSVGGEPPTEMIVLPFPEWELEDITLKTGTRSQEMVLADIRRHGADIHFDYHHQSLYAVKYGYVADAAGWMPHQSFFADTRGIGGKTLWVADGEERIRTGKMRYTSPVVLYDEKTLEVTALLSCALTNTPRTNNQSPLTAALAASSPIFARRLVASRGGCMEKWVSVLINFLEGLWCYSADELLAHIDKARGAFVEVMGEGSEAAAAASIEFAKTLPKDATILQALIAHGLKIPDDAVAQLAASKQLLAADDVADLCTIVGLDATKTTRKSLAAHLVGMVTTMVPRIEIEKKDAELAAARELEGKNKIDTLLKVTYADRWAPSEESQLRQLAATNFDAVELNLKTRQPIVQATSQAKSAPAATASAAPSSEPGDVTVRTMVVAGETRIVSEDGFGALEATKAILAENGWGMSRYGEANKIRLEREAVAAK